MIIKKKKKPRIDKKKLGMITMDLIEQHLQQTRAAHLVESRRCKSIVLSAVSSALLARRCKVAMHVDCLHQIRVPPMWICWQQEISATQLTYAKRGRTSHSLDECSVVCFEW